MIITASARAGRQIEAAATWWREHRSSEAIAQQIDWIVGLLEINPRLGEPVHNARRPGYRRFYLERIGYHLYYRYEETKARIVIVAFWHERRRPLRL